MRGAARPASAARSVSWPGSQAHTRANTAEKSVWPLKGRVDERVSVMVPTMAGAERGGHMDGYRAHRLGFGG